MIIGITGPAYSGKDTAADLMLCGLPPDWRKVSFAEPMKQMLAVGLGLSHGQLHGTEKEVVDQRYGCTPRHIMQTIGTEWGRRLIHPDIWVAALASQVDGKNVIIPDVRFANEAVFVRSRGVLVHVKGRGGIAGDHLSERGIEQKPCDFVLWNDDGLGQYREEVAEMLDDIFATVMFRKE